MIFGNDRLVTLGLAISGTDTAEATAEFIR
jgi:hypothetical protein